MGYGTNVKDLIGLEFPVLDKGFVRVVDVMGNDESIVQAARVSYGKGVEDYEKDRRLIRYLMRHDHTSPFEMCEIKLHVKVPMDIWRQWVRHRTANINEYSTRYSKALNEMHETAEKDWRRQSKINKQGSAGYLNITEGKFCSSVQNTVFDKAYKSYDALIKWGVAREQARKVLPLATYTEAYWKIDLKNLLHFLKLRLDPTAQFEFRHYATVIGYKIVSQWVPITWEAFVDYKLNSLTLSNRDVYLINKVLGGDNSIDIFIEMGFVSQSQDGTLKLTGEGREFIDKTARLNIRLPKKIYDLM